MAHPGPIYLLKNASYCRSTRPIIAAGPIKRNSKLGSIGFLLTIDWWGSGGAPWAFSSPEKPTQAMPKMNTLVLHGTNMLHAWTCTLQTSVTLFAN